MKMINTMDEAILNSNKGVKNTEGNMVTNSILYSRWEKHYAKTIKDFYKDFIEPRLPDIKVLEKAKIIRCEICCCGIKCRFFTA